MSATTSWTGRIRHHHNAFRQLVIFATAGFAIFCCISVLAQPVPSPKPNPPQSSSAPQASSPSKEDSKTFLEEVWEKISKDKDIRTGAAGLITFLVGAGLTAAYSTIQSNRKDKKVTALEETTRQLSDENSILEKDKESLEQTTAALEQKNGELTRRLAGVRFGLPEQYIESYNKVLLVGLGGSGKTTLIRTLTGNKMANPRIKSDDILTYSLVHEITYQDNHSGFAKSHVCRIDIDDYRGQETAQILGGWQLEKLDSVFSCTSVIFLVDLFHEPPHSDDAQQPKKIWDSTRVQKHLTEWPQGLVRSIVAMARPGNLRYMCLFVNKVDLLRVYPSEKAPEIFDAFRSIDEALLNVSAGALYERIIGSAERDIGVSRILNKLVEVSSPAGPGP